jgi:NadR type nicotinamide-nucleotide adenylyltransferase
LNKQFRYGLVVGKFCPLHRGHESVIKRAIECCDEVVVISYTKPEFDGCGPTAREKWIGELFPAVTRLVIDDHILRRRCDARHVPAIFPIPHNDAPEADHREFVGWLCCSVLVKAVDAVFTSEAYGEGFARHLSRYFQNRVPDFGTVVHVCVDQTRERIPISGTTIRSSPHRFLEFLSAAVYASFVKRVCLLGGESTGKTTLAQALAARLQTAWAAEFGRELWDLKNGRLEFEDMLRIGVAQMEREDALKQEANTWLVCDTSPLTTLFYSLDLFGKADPKLVQLACREYDHVFLCAPDFPFVQDSTRRDESFRNRQHEWYSSELCRKGIRFTTLHGGVDHRANTALSILENFAAGKKT